MVPNKINYCSNNKSKSNLTGDIKLMGLLGMNERKKKSHIRFLLTCVNKINKLITRQIKKINLLLSMFKYIWHQVDRLSTT